MGCAASTEAGGQLESDKAPSVNDIADIAPSEQATTTKDEERSSPSEEELAATKLQAHARSKAGRAVVAEARAAAPASRHVSVSAEEMAAVRARMSKLKDEPVKPKVEVKIDESARAEFEGKVAMLQARFPDKGAVEIRQALQKAGGHVGRASRYLGPDPYAESKKTGTTSSGNGAGVAPPSLKPQSMGDIASKQASNAREMKNFNARADRLGVKQTDAKEFAEFDRFRTMQAHSLEPMEA